MSQRIYTIFNEFPRIGTKLELPKEVQEMPFTKLLQNDTECKEMQGYIDAEVEYNKSEITIFLFRWNYFKNVWEKTEEEFVKTLEATNQLASDFEISIEFYNQLADDLAIQDSISNVYFTLISVNLLKNTIMDYIEKWQLLNVRMLTKRATSRIKSE